MFGVNKIPMFVVVCKWLIISWSHRMNNRAKWPRLVETWQTLHTCIYNIFIHNPYKTYWKTSKWTKILGSCLTIVKVCGGYPSYFCFYFILFLKFSVSSSSIDHIYILKFALHEQTHELLATQNWTSHELIIFHGSTCVQIP